MELSIRVDAVSSLQIPVLPFGLIRVLLMLNKC